MKYNADINLRERARRRWFIVLGCAVVAGGYWFRADLQKKQAAARSAPTAAELLAEAPGSGGADDSVPSFLDESMLAPFRVPGIGFAEFDAAAEEGWLATDYTRPIRFGLGGGEERASVAISVSGGSPGAVMVGPQVTELDRPAAPQAPAVPTRRVNVPQTLPQPR
jgi:hypothetical protein